MLQKTSIGDEGASPHDDLSTAIAAMPANARQRKVAVTALIVLVIIVAGTIPLVQVRFPHINSFVPIVETAICITNLLTAAFLFAQYSVYPRRALLVLAGGFVFSGLFAFLHILAFPGALGSGSLIGDGPNSQNWLYSFWLALFPATVIVYALSKEVGEVANRSGRLIRIDIGVTVACVVAATAALTWVAISGDLPLVHQENGDRTLFQMPVSAVRTLLTVTAFVVLFVRRRTVLDQWLLVTLPAWMPNLVEAIWSRHLLYTASWYLGRIYGLFAGSALLFVLLTETLLLYRRSNQSQRLLIAELDHRVKNVLAQVAAVAASTVQGSRSIDEFLGSLNGRIQSMAAGHTLLSENHWGSVGLDAVVHSQLAPYAAGTNVRISGADVMLTAAETQAVTRVLHELATNAAKYGALSIPGGGHVSVSWDLKPNGAATNLILLWRELGGPPLASEHPSSYGTSLICNLIPHELGGTVDLVFAKEGVNCRIEIPVSEA